MNINPRKGLRRFERDETLELRKLIEQMNLLHANMGGRDSRPERRALIQAMNALEKGVQQARAEQQAVWELQLQTRSAETPQSSNRTPDAPGMG